MALSQDEMQSIINAVLSSIRTNSRTINQLTPVTSLDENDYFELSGGRRIRFDVLRQMILPEYEEDYNVVAAIKTLRSTIEKINSDNEIRDERLESLEKFKDRKGRPGGIAPLNHDGIIDEQYLPELLRNGGCFPLPEFEKVIQSVENAGQPTPAQAVLKVLSLVRIGRKEEALKYAVDYFHSLNSSLCSLPVQNEFVSESTRMFYSIGIQAILRNFIAALSSPDEIPVDDYDPYIPFDASI